MSWQAQIRRDRFSQLRFSQYRNDLSKAVEILSLEVRDRDMSLKLQGIASKMALLHHNVELDADKLDKAIDAADQRRQAVMPKANKVIDDTHKDLAGVETFISSIEQISNGGEKIDDKTPVPPVGAYPSYP